MKQKVEQGIGYGILTLFCAGVLLPFVSIVLVSLAAPGPSVNGLSVPPVLHFENYARAWNDGGFAQLIVSSLIVCAGVVPAVAVFSLLAGYAFGTMSFPGKNAIFYILLAGLVVPYEAAVIPLYYSLRTIGLVDTYLGLILPLIGLSMAFGTFWMRSYFATAPEALIDAGRMDGATSWVILWRILFRGAWPALSTLIVLVFLWTWNEFLLALVLIQDPARRTAPAGLGNFIGANTTDVSGLSAGALIITVPVLVVYLIFQRTFVRGLLSGSVKG